MTNYIVLVGAAALIICGAIAGLVQAPKSVDAQNRETPDREAKRARAKDEKLPPLLRPSDYAVDRAKEMGGEVFKLLPLEGASQRGSSFGAYYSFKNRSYGGADQFGFLRGEFRVHDPRNHGFFADLGQRDLRDVDRASPEAAYFVAYKPPKLGSEIDIEIERLRDINIDGVKLTRKLSVRVGHTYLLRSIDYIYGSDIAVILHVVESSTDGTITIVWKELAKFPIPIKLFMPDEEMQKKVDAVLTELQIPGLRIKVEDNRILVINGKAGPEFEKLKEALHERKIPYRGLGYSVVQQAASKIPE